MDEHRGKLNPHATPIVFYDGGCSLCSREIDHYRKLDWAAAIEWVDISREPERMQPYGLTRDQAMLRLHALDEQRQWRIGTQAFLLIWSRLPGYRWLSRLLKATGLHRLLEPAYRRFADLRLKRRARSASCDLR